MTTDKRTKTGAEMETEVLEKIAQFSQPHQAIARRMHELIKQANPTLQARLWYGMPGYAKTKDSAVLCFFREDVFMVFGLTEHVMFKPKSDATDSLMPSAWFFTKLDDATETKIVEIVKEATTN